MSLLSLWFMARIPELVVRIIKSSKLIKLCTAMRLFNRRCSQKVENVEEEESRDPELGLLDLPELVLENIFGRLSPANLISTAGVCRELRKRCTSDHLWDTHIKAKWDRVAGIEVRRGWQWHWHWIAAMNEEMGTLEMSQCSSTNRIRQISWPCVWPFSCFSTSARQEAKKRYVRSSTSLRHSSMTWYVALETGSFWFPAQVYNREHGHVGFVLSCYDAYLCYDRQSNTFKARYLPHGSRSNVVEEGIQWERIRSPPVDTPAHMLYISDCLDNLHPGDHVEVQWRKNKEFPYGWWYGVVGHSDACQGSNYQCQCHLDEIAWLEFNQYSLGSRWRRAPIKRLCHRESGSEAEGFYGGIRKLEDYEVLTWKLFWPREILE